MSNRGLNTCRRPRFGSATTTGYGLIVELVTLLAGPDAGDPQACTAGACRLGLVALLPQVSMKYLLGSLAEAIA